MALLFTGFSFSIYISQNGHSLWWCSVCENTSSVPHSKYSSFLFCTGIPLSFFRNRNGMIYYSFCSHFSFRSLSFQLKIQKLLQKPPFLRLPLLAIAKRYTKANTVVVRSSLLCISRITRIDSIFPHQMQQCWTIGPDWWLYIFYPYSDLLSAFCIALHTDHHTGSANIPSQSAF